MAKRKSKNKAKGYLLPKYQTEGRIDVYQNGDLHNYRNGRKTDPDKTIDSFYSKKEAKSMGTDMSYPYRTLQNPSYGDLRIEAPQYNDNVLHPIRNERRYRPSNIPNNSSQLPQYQTEGKVKISPEEYSAKAKAYRDSSRTDAYTKQFMKDFYREADDRDSSSYPYYNTEKLTPGKDWRDGQDIDYFEKKHSQLLEGTSHINPVSYKIADFKYADYDEFLNDIESRRPGNKDNAEFAKRHFDDSHQDFKYQVPIYKEPTRPSETYEIDFPWYQDVSRWVNKGTDKMADFAAENRPEWMENIEAGINDFTGKVGDKVYDFADDLLWNTTRNQLKDVKKGWVLVDGEWKIMPWADTSDDKPMVKNEPIKLIDSVSTKTSPTLEEIQRAQAQKEVVPIKEPEAEVIRPSITKVVKDSEGNIISQEEGISQKEAGRRFNAETQSWENFQNGGPIHKYQNGEEIDPRDIRVDQYGNSFNVRDIATNFHSNGNASSYNIPQSSYRNTGFFSSEEKQAIFADNPNRIFVDDPDKRKGTQAYEDLSNLSNPDYAKGDKQGLPLHVRLEKGPMAPYNYQNGGLHQYGGKVESYQNGTEVLENIYKNYPGLKNLGEVTLKPDTSFTKEKTGIGDIEYFSPTQDSVRYSNYTVPHPNIGTHGILYNPNTNTEQNIALDMLHGMSSADPKYKKLRNNLKKKILSSKFNNYLEHYWKEYNSEFKENDGKERFVDTYVDGIIRGLLFEGSDEDFENARYSREANEEYLKNKEINNEFDKLNSYIKGYENGGEVVVPMQQELPHQEIVSFPTEREPYVDPKIPMWANKDYYKNIYNTNVRESLAKQYSIWKSIFKSPDGINIEGYKNIYDIQEFFNSGEWRKGFKNVEKYRKPSHPMLGEIDPETLTFMPSERNVNTNEEIADYILQENIPVNFKKVERIPINPDGFAPGSATEFADKVVIPSGNITMKDMQEPILANGEMLMPGDEAQFDTDYVVEEKLPKAQDGLKVEGQKLSKKEVDDLKNFVEDDTNFVQEYPYLLDEVVVEDKLDRTNPTAVRNWSKDNDPIAYAAREAMNNAAKDWVGPGLAALTAPITLPLLGAGAGGLAATGEAAYGALSPYASAAWNTNIPGALGMSSVPGATIGNALNTSFIAHGATNIGPDALELLTNPLSLENLANVGIDVLEMAPMYGPMSKMLGELGTIGKSSKPTSAAAIEGVLPKIKKPNKEYTPTKAELDAYGITQAQFDAPKFTALENKFFKSPDEYMINKTDNTSKWKMYEQQKKNIDELAKYDKSDYEGKMASLEAEYLNFQNEESFKRLNSLEKNKAMEKYLYELERLSEKMNHKADLKLIVQNDKFKKYEPVGMLEEYAEATNYTVKAGDPKSIEAFKAWQKNQMPSPPEEILLNTKPGKFPLKNEKRVDSKGIIQEPSPMGSDYRFDDNVGGRLPELMKKHKASFEAKFGKNYSEQDLGLYAKLQEIENLDRYITDSFNRYKNMSDEFIKTQNLTKEYTAKEELLLNIYTRGYDRKINRRKGSASDRVLRDFYEKHIAADMEKLIKKNKLEEPVTVSRRDHDWMVESVWDKNGNKLKPRMFSELEEGMEWMPNSFQSTSILERSPLGGPIHTLIEAPAGQSIAFPNASGVRNYQNEMELILPQKLKYRVTEVYRPSNIKSFDDLEHLQEFSATKPSHMLTKKGPIVRYKVVTDEGKNKLYERAYREVDRGKEIDFLENKTFTSLSNKEAYWKEITSKAEKDDVLKLYNKQQTKDHYDKGENIFKSIVTNPYSLIPLLLYGQQKTK